MSQFKSPRYKHILVFPHRTDLLHMLSVYCNEEHQPALAECINTIGFEGALIQLVVAELPLPMQINEKINQEDPALPLLWRNKLLAAYRLEEGGYLKTILHKETDGEALRVFLCNIIDHMPVYTGPIGFQLGKQQSS